MAKFNSRTLLIMSDIKIKRSFYGNLQMKDVSVSKRSYIWLVSFWRKWIDQATIVGTRANSSAEFGNTATNDIRCVTKKWRSELTWWMRSERSCGYHKGRRGSGYCTLVHEMISWFNILSLIFNAKVNIILENPRTRVFYSSQDFTWLFERVCFRNFYVILKEVKRKCQLIYIFLLSNTKTTIVLP